MLLQRSLKPFFALLIWASAFTQSWATEIMTSEREALTQSTGGCTNLLEDTFDYEGFISKLEKTSDKAIEQLYLDLGPKQRHRLLRLRIFNQYLSEISDVDRNRLLLMLDPMEVNVELRPHLLPQIDAAFKQFQNHLIAHSALTDLCQDAYNKRKCYVEKRRLNFLNDLVEMPTEQAEIMLQNHVSTLWSYNKFSFLTLDMIQGFLKKALGPYCHDLAAENDLDKLMTKSIKSLEERRLNIETQGLKRSYEFTPEILQARQSLARSYLMHQVFLNEIRSVSQWNEETASKPYKAQKLDGLLSEYEILTDMMFSFLEQEAKRARASLGQRDS